MSATCKMSGPCDGKFCKEVRCAERYDATCGVCGGASYDRADPCDDLLRYCNGCRGWTMFRKEVKP